jgi:hypothetical protein
MRAISIDTKLITDTNFKVTHIKFKVPHRTLAGAREIANHSRIASGIVGTDRV